MSKSNNTFTLTLGAAFAVAALSSPVAHAGSVFESVFLAQGYQLAANTAAPAEGKCGADKKAEAKCGADKMKDGKCGADKAAATKKKDGKCGEGKCGAGMKKQHDGKCGADKKADGSCGAAKK